MRVHSAMRARVFVADGHVFDKAQVDGAVERESREGRHILVEPAHHNTVDLNRLKAPGQSRVDAGHGLLESTQARDLSKERRVERIERDVDAVKPGIFELRRQLGQQGAVGGERDVLDLQNRADVANERNDTAADQRLAARQAHAANALPRHQAHKAGDFLGAEQLVVRAGRHAIGRHAVNAAEIALVGNGNAQVVDIAAKAVMLHAPVHVHVALPSRGVLFFGKHNTPRENHADTRTTGQVASSKTNFPSPSSACKPSQHSMLFPLLAKNVECCDGLPARSAPQKDRNVPKGRRPSAESRILAGRFAAFGTLRFGRT